MIYLTRRQVDEADKALAYIQRHFEDCDTRFPVGVQKAVFILRREVVRESLRLEGKE